VLPNLIACVPASSRIKPTMRCTDLIAGHTQTRRRVPTAPVPLPSAAGPNRLTTIVAAVIVVVVAIITGFDAGAYHPITAARGGAIV